MIAFVWFFLEEVVIVSESGAIEASNVRVRQRPCDDARSSVSGVSGNSLYVEAGAGDLLETWDVVGGLFSAAGQMSLVLHS